MFRAIKQHVTETYHGKQRHGTHVDIASYVTDSNMAETEL